MAYRTLLQDAPMFPIIVYEDNYKEYMAMIIYSVISFGLFSGFMTVYSERATEIINDIIRKRVTTLYMFFH